MGVGGMLVTVWLFKVFWLRAGFGLKVLAQGVFLV